MNPSPVTQRQPLSIDPARATQESVPANTQSALGEDTFNRVGRCLTSCFSPVVSVANDSMVLTSKAVGLSYDKESIGNIGMATVPAASLGSFVGMCMAGPVGAGIGALAGGAVGMTAGAALDVVEAYNKNDNQKTSFAGRLGDAIAVVGTHYKAKIGDGFKAMWNRPIASAIGLTAGITLLAMAATPVVMTVGLGTFIGSVCALLGSGYQQCTKEQENKAAWSNANDQPVEEVESGVEENDLEQDRNNQPQPRNNQLQTVLEERSTQGSELDGQPKNDQFDEISLLDESSHSFVSGNRDQQPDVHCDISSPASSANSSVDDLSFRVEFVNTVIEEAREQGLSSQALSGNSVASTGSSGGDYASLNLSDASHESGDRNEQRVVQDD